MKNPDEKTYNFCIWQNFIDFRKPFSQLPQHQTVEK